MDTKSTPTLTLGITAFNEAKIIVGVIEELERWMATQLPEISFEILIVDDGSDDGMGELLSGAAINKPFLKIFRHKKNIGRGMGIRTAMENARGRFMVALDADLSYGPEHIKTLLDPLLSDDADITLASPYHRDGVVKNVPTLRLIMSKIGNKILSRSFDGKYNTATCVVRGYNRKAIENLFLVNVGKELHLEVLYKAEILGLRIKEMPAKLIWRNRNRRRERPVKILSLRDNTLISMRHVIKSHILFNFIAKPTLIFIFPAFIFFCVTVFGVVSLGSELIQNIGAGERNALRLTLFDGLLTLLLTIVSLFMSLFFVSLMFVVSQARKYFEESYVLMSKTHSLVKTIAGKNASREN